VVTAQWTPTHDWEGFENIIHGGIVSTVLDEAMSKAVVLANCEALTGELRVRFRRHVTPGETIQIRGWVAARRKRLIETEATLTGASGLEYAHAWASFLALRHPVKEEI
jgi:acyl-coenzyme A thioesterase PaaI-like protein